MAGWHEADTHVDCSCLATLRQPHFGVALAVDDFHALAKRLKEKGVKFVIEVCGALRRGMYRLSNCLVHGKCR